MTDDREQALDATPTPDVAHDAAAPAGEPAPGPEGAFGCSFQEGGKCCCLERGHPGPHNLTY